jgi:hypothetical protein
LSSGWRRPRHLVLEQQRVCESLREGPRTAGAHFKFLAHRWTCSASPFLTLVPYVASIRDLGEGSVTAADKSAFRLANFFIPLRVTSKHCTLIGLGLSFNPHLYTAAFSITEIWTRLLLYTVGKCIRKDAALRQHGQALGVTTTAWTRNRIAEVLTATERRFDGTSKK